MFVLNEENKIIVQMAAISPIDGRYYTRTKELCQYFSEYAFSYRLHIEVSYLCELLNMLMDKSLILAIYRKSIVLLQNFQ